MLLFYTFDLLCINKYNMCGGSYTLFDVCIIRTAHVCFVKYRHVSKQLKNIAWYNETILNKKIIFFSQIDRRILFVFFFLLFFFLFSFLYRIRIEQRIQRKSNHFRSESVLRKEYNSVVSVIQYYTDAIKFVLKIFLKHSYQWFNY